MATKFKVTRVKDSGFKRILSNTKKADGSRIEVGIYKTSRANKSAVRGSAANNLAYRYAIHDQGRGNNPQRETLRPGINKALATDPVVRNFLNAGLDKRSYNAQAKRAGARLAATVKKQVTALRKPAKLRSTILSAQRRLGGGTRGNPLIQTGEMRSAITSRYFV